MPARDEALLAQKAATLIESLPWLERYRGATMVVKYGGNAMVSEDLQRAFAEDVVYLRHVGIRPVVVHGGGPQISEALRIHGIESEFRGGYRVTSREAMDVVRMVLTGQVARTLVSLINAHGPVAASMSGEDAGLFTGRRRGVVIDGQEHDLGQVGDVVAVDPAPVQRLLDAGLVPVVSSIAPDGDRPGESLNVNADAAAAALAAALGAQKLVILTDVEGLYADWPDRSSLISELTDVELAALMPSLESGMIPKMQACLDAVRAGVPKAAIIDGRSPHSILTEIFTSAGSGTEVVPAPADATHATVLNAKEHA
ncbi:acetylglutamate kinase [Agrococcus sp. SL85]|uniref:acetylglutamate kinase n=1 Tax=Agrococcus sp. SL85 TaxID=2995141 RepID=UPI00226C8C96|nr:acetylglutamate kinase [Agrococcus sp. SL85]WAC66237.1 acetylglutamate kinase [Agrococcus sp. SL85]